MKADFRRSQLELLILSVLKDGPMHGYAVIAALAGRSGGVFDLPEGTVYPLLHKLEAADLITSQWEQAAGRKRRLYAITRVGRGALVERSNEWRRWSNGIDQILDWSAA